jgi:hypothetical protein
MRRPDDLVGKPPVTFVVIRHQLTLADADWASASDCLPPVTFTR